MEKKVEEIMSLHMDFWDHKLEKPIINKEYSLWRREIHMLNLDEALRSSPEMIDVLHPDWKGKDNTIIKPQMLSPDRHQTFYEYDDKCDDVVVYPVFNTIIPWTMVTWLPAIAGCDIKISEKGETLWPEPYIGEGWTELEDYGIKYDYNWLEKLTEFTKYLVDKHYPTNMVSLEMFSRGPGDILLSAMDNEVAYTSMFDHPDNLKDILMDFADLHIRWSKAQLDVIPGFEGGYCNQWGIWAPGTVTRIQEDFAINLGKKHYMEFIQPADEKVIKASDYQVFHTHSGSPQYACWVANIEALKVVEVTLDPISPPLEELIPGWNKILENKSMIITGTLTRKQVDMLVSKLDVSGLFLDIVVLD